MTSASSRALSDTPVGCRLVQHLWQLFLPDWCSAVAELHSACFARRFTYNFPAYDLTCWLNPEVYSTPKLGW